MQLELLNNSRDMLNLVTATLRDSALEKKYLASQILAYRTPLCIIALLILVVDLWSLALEFFIPGVIAITSPILWIRVFAILLGPVFILLNRSLAKPEYLSFVSETYLCLIILLTFSTLYFHPDYDYIAPITMVCVTFAIYALAPFTWIRLLIYNLAFTIFGGVFFLMSSSNAVDISRVSQWLFVAQGLGIVTSWLRNIQLRELFLARQTLQRRWQQEAKYRMQNYALVDLLTHELRNPLAAIGAQAELIQRLSEDKVKKLAEDIEASVHAADKLISEWLSSDRLGHELRPGSSQVEPINVARLVERVVLENRATSEYVRINLDLRCGQSVLSHVDPRVLSLALNNLIENGIKYSAVDSRLTDPPTLTVSVRLSEKLIKIRVRDFGVGIESGSYEKVFSKYQRLSLAPDVRGSGVGLFLCRSLLQLEGGDIRFVSRVGLGSAFSILVPLSVQSSAP